MLIISVEIMKTKTETRKGNKSYSERLRSTWFCWAFKIAFLHLICKDSLIFKWNLELELYESKHVVMESRFVILYETCYPF